MKQNVIKKNDDWGMIRAAVTFGGNIYLLDTQKSRIWKYIGQESGFSEMREYLNPDTLPDLSGATGMAIDGSVWLGTTNGKILRFTQGKENAFTARGVEPALGMNLVVATSDSEKNLYILDKNNKRVVVLDKDGIYLAQYSWEKQIMASELAVSEKQGKIFLLAGGKLYSIDLK
jgi:outer membrane protein assembly factor BamB